MSLAEAIGSVTGNSVCRLFLGLCIRTADSNIAAGDPGSVVMTDDAQQVAHICKALGDEMRVQIVRLLARETFGVQELARIFSVPQPLMSHHLKVLSQADVLTTRRQGNVIFYRRQLGSSQDMASGLRRSLFAAIDEVPVNDSLQQAVAAIHEDRSVQSREFFARFAPKFSQQQAQLCESSQYLSNVVELLDVMALSKDARVMEVGPGEGQVLAELARRFERVTALDNSTEMLEIARKRTESIGRKIEFVHGDIESLTRQIRGDYNAMVLNMVLHHVASPSSALTQLSGVLATNGYLLIADLCLHSQDWVRESCGDLWLGFDSEELDGWARAAHLQCEHSLFLGLKNGFQILLKLFRKVS